MVLSPSAFETIVPSRYIVFTLPGLDHRIAVLDSPFTAVADASTTPSTAAMWVPFGRESDWVFSTFSGHLQLLSTPTSQPLSRLILIGNPPISPHPISYSNSTIKPSSVEPQQNLAPLFLALTPKSVSGEISEVPFFDYEDEVVRSSVLEICEGPCVGEMLIENVELENDCGKEFRRRLRFKRMPNFVQSQIRIHPKKESMSENLDDMEFELDKGVLVQPYLSPMVAGISVISKFLDACSRKRVIPKALCLGAGGGSLVGFLRARLNFEVVGVDKDDFVLEIAKRYFGLESDESIHLVAEDAVKYVKDLSKNISEESKFHVVMVDLDSSDVNLDIFAPPQEFVRKSVFEAIRGVLCDEGVLIINMIPSSKLGYEGLIGEAHKVFEELHQIDVGNDENFVLIAPKLRIEYTSNDNEGSVLNKLRSIVPGSYIDSIRKIPKTADHIFGR